MESWDLESGMKLMGSGIPKTIGIQNPSYTENEWNPVSGVRNPRHEIHVPRLTWISLCGDETSYYFVICLLNLRMQVNNLGFLKLFGLKMEYFQNCLVWLIIIFLWTCLPVQNPILSCLPCVTMILVSVNSKLPDAHHSFSKTNLYSAGRWTPLLSQATQAQCVSLIINTCSFMLRNLKWPWIYRTTPKGASTFSPRHTTVENPLGNSASSTN